MNRHRDLANVLPFLPAKVRQNLRIRKYCGALLYSIVPPSAVMTEKVPCKKPRQEWIYRTLCMELFCYGELVFSYSAEGTFKIVRQFFEGCAGCDAGFRQSFGGIILPAADVTNVGFHNGQKY